MKTLVMILGVVFLLIGVVGFFNNPVVGAFPVNMLHNIIHLLSGILVLGFAMRSESGAIMVSKVVGVIYAIVAILGFVMADFMGDLLANDMADNWLHVVLAVVFLWIGFATKPKQMAQVGM